MISRTLRSLFFFGNLFVGLSSSVAREEADGEVWFRRVQAIRDSVASKKTEDLLPLLPKELRGRHILIFDSPSLQEASLKNPRVLLISPLADFVMSFNGHPSQKGFESIETMRFVRRNGIPKFVFEEIFMTGDAETRRQFIDGDKNLTRKEKNNALQDLEERKNIVGENPQLCLGCHRETPRPNWNHYAFWPNVFGQLDDRPLATNLATEIDPSSGEKIIVDNEPAAKALKTFVETLAPNHARYGSLLSLKKQIAVQPVVPYGSPNSEPTFNLRNDNSPLTSFSSDLAQLQFQQIAHQLKTATDPYASRKVVYLAWSCDKIATSRFLSKADNMYASLDKMFSDSPLAWQDFFMNFYPGPGNSFMTPGEWSRELTFFILKLNPELTPLFDIETKPAYYSPIQSLSWAAPTQAKTSAEICKALKTW